MSTEDERELRTVLNDAQMRRNDFRLFEIGAVTVSVVLLFIAFAATALDLDVRHLLAYTSAAGFLIAAFYNLYGSIIIQPRLTALQRQLNEKIQRNG